MDPPPAYHIQAPKLVPGRYETIYPSKLSGSLDLQDCEQNKTVLYAQMYNILDSDVQITDQDQTLPGMCCLFQGAQCSGIFIFKNLGKAGLKPLEATEVQSLYANLGCV